MADNPLEQKIVQSVLEFFSQENEDHIIREKNGFAELLEYFIPYALNANISLDLVRMIKVVKVDSATVEIFGLAYSMNGDREHFCLRFFNNPSELPFYLVFKALNIKDFQIEAIYPDLSSVQWQYTTGGWLQQ